MKQLKRIKLQSAVVLQNSEMKVMMLKIICVLLLLNSSCYLSANIILNDSSELRITYEFQQKAMSDGQLINLTDTMVLSIDNNMSNYFDMYLSRRDSIEESSFNQMNSISVSGNHNELERMLDLKDKADITLNDREYNKTQFSKDRSLHQIITTHRGSSKYEEFKVIEEIVFDWDIPNTETDTILNYACMIATTKFRGRIFTAWFTLDIPIGEGPWKFYGLPGLILKIEDSEGIFKFNAIGLEKFKKENNKSELSKIKEEIITNQQLQNYINNKQKIVSYGFYNDANITFYKRKNNVIYPEIEIEDK